MSKAQKYLPPVGFFFTVKLLRESAKTYQKVDAAFQEVTGISAEMQFDDIKEGGENRFVHKVPGRVKYDNLVLKRGVVVWPSDFGTWCRKGLKGGMLSTKDPDKVEPHSIQVQLMDAAKQGAPLMSWTFVNALPLKWEIGGLDAKTSGLAIETLTFTYQYFEASEQQNKRYLKVKK